MIRVVHPGSQIRMLTFYPSQIPDPGVKKEPDPGTGSATLKNAPFYGQSNFVFNGSGKGNRIRIGGPDPPKNLFSPDPTANNYVCQLHVENRLGYLPIK